MRYKVIFLVFILMFSTPFASCLFESTSTLDETDDGIDNMLFYMDGIRVPAPLVLDVVNVGASLNGSILSIRIDCAAPIPLDAPYSLQIALDTDQSQATGESNPEWYYNQLGIDYLIKAESTEGIIQAAISEYQGVWVESGTPEVVVDDSTITATMNLSQIGGSQSASYVVYVVQGIAVDIAPEEGKLPPSFSITKGPTPEEPPVIDINPDLVLVVSPIEYTEPLEEGTPFELDASTTLIDPSMAPYIYEWDLDGDGVY